MLSSSFPKSPDEMPSLARPSAIMPLRRSVLPSANDRKDAIVAKSESQEPAGHAAQNGVRVEHSPIEESPNDEGEIIATAAAIAVVAVGAAVFEAALLPGLALGVVAALAPRVLPNIGTAMAPMFRSSVRGVYRLGRRTREMVAEAQEHVGDIVAEADAEHRSKADASTMESAPLG
jgi:hypothetical protein